METYGSTYDALAAALGITPDDGEGNAAAGMANLVMHVEWLQEELGTIRLDLEARSATISRLLSMRTERDALAVQLDGLRAARAEMRQEKDHWRALAERLALPAPAPVPFWRRLLGM